MNDEGKELPKGMKLMLDPGFLSNPYPLLKSLRERAPVMNDDQFNLWFLTEFDAIRQILRDREMSRDGRQGNPDSSHAAKLLLESRPPSGSRPLASMLFMDEDGHRRIRAFMNKAFFTPRALEALRPRVREIAQTLAAEIRGPQFDLMTGFAERMSATVMAEIMGIDPAERSTFKSLSDAVFVTLYNPFRAADKTAVGMQAQEQLDAYFLQLIEQRRRSPGTDLISALLGTEDRGDHLTDDEVVAQCSLLLIAGQITTADLIGNAVRALLEHPQELAKLRAQPQLINSAIEETLRYDVPTMLTYRIVQSEMEVGGCPFHRGDVVTLALAGANHDPAANPDPERFDIERQNIQHQSFGGGKHMCLGAPLARIEAQEAVTALLARFPDLRASARGYRQRRIPGRHGLSAYWLEVQGT